MSHKIAVPRRIASLRRTCSSHWPWRRAAASLLVPGCVLAGALLLASAAATAGPCGQKNWIQSLPGFEDDCAPSARDLALLKERRRKAAKAQLRDLRPDSTPFRSQVMLDAIEGAIGRYQAVVANGGWPTIAKGRYLRPGSSYQRVRQLRRRLMVTGDLNRRAGIKSYSYDGEVEAAVKRFQLRHGLRTSGVVDSPTLAHLNMTAKERLQQLRVNRQRLEEYLAEPPEARYVLVNVPAFQLEAVEGQQVVQRHRVIVGKPDRQTPPLKAFIRGINFFPYWRVPDSVAHRDIIPRLRKQPSYLDQQFFRVLDEFGGNEIDPRSVDWNAPEALQLKFRQDPGPHNALGLLRIDMPNDEIVYMHDTPMKKLFNRRRRSFSAGCVRVQDVTKLAAWIASSEEGWDRTRIDEILAAGVAENLKLPKSIPVYFAYITAWAEPDGPVQFRNDLYGRDGPAQAAGVPFDEPPAPPPKQILSP